MSSNEALKPCPIDGGKAEWRQHPIGGTGSSGMEAPDLSIRCTVCGLQTTRERTEKWERGKGTYSIKAVAEAKLISRWNTRSTDTLVPASTELTPSELAYLRSPNCGRAGFRKTPEGHALYEKGYLDGVGRTLPKALDLMRDSRATIAASQAPETIERLREALTDARTAIDSLDEDALGRHPELGYPYRDELLAKIGEALSSIPEPLRASHEQ